ncbi:MAG: GLUG motif-containing protein, partial [Candidatus Cloacimonadaceae bacterium]|nr:GLUG motif-containing protein [Candidatus Cloacimonadaceae bacterium]
NLKVLNADISSAATSVSVLVGELYAGTVENCHVSVSASGILRGGGNVGGVVGLVPNISNPIAPRQIIRCSADVKIEISGTGSGGGLCGSLVTGLIKESYATGTLTLLNSNSTSQYLGGLVGSVSNSSNVLDSYSRVNLIRNAGTAVNLGGFAGANINSNIQRCYSTGTVRDASNNPVGTNNGFVAFLWVTDANYKMLNNFWDAQSSGISGTVSNTNNSSEAPQSRNTHQMNSMKTFTDKSWDFRGETTNGTNYIWNIGNGRNNNYPYLNWQHFSDPDPVVTAAINPSPAHNSTGVSTNAQLSWETGIIAAPWGYKINFGTNSPPTNILQNHDNGTALSYNPGELDLDQTYYWQIVPYNASDALDCPIWSFTTIDVAPPAIPVAIASTENTGTSFRANWNAAANADGYYLDVAYDTNFTMFLSGYNNRNVGNVTSFDVTGLPNGAGVLYRVRSYNPSGNSANSNTIKLTL